MPPRWLTSAQTGCIHGLFFPHISCVTSSLFSLRWILKGFIDLQGKTQQPPRAAARYSIIGFAFMVPGMRETPGQCEASSRPPLPPPPHSFIDMKCNRTNHNSSFLARQILNPVLPGVPRHVFKTPNQSIQVGAWLKCRTSRPCDHSREVKSSPGRAVVNNWTDFQSIADIRAEGKKAFSHR